MVDRRYLVDTNIFLEILLSQTKQKDCKEFVEDHFPEITLSQFTLNSIGISCFKNKRADLFTGFLYDLASSLPILTLTPPQLILLETTINSNLLDYDDSYQLITAQIHNLEIVTLDQDFKKVQNQIKVHFL